LVSFHLLEEESKVAGKLDAILLPERDEVEKDASHFLVIRQNLLGQGLWFMVQGSGFRV